MKWVDTLRITLLLSLSLLFIYMLAKRFKQKVMAKELPIASHAELLSVQVLYHPARLRMEVLLPSSEVLRPSVLDTEHVLVHKWEVTSHGNGKHVLELSLIDVSYGDYFLELATSSQRTVRKFSVKHT